MYLSSASNFTITQLYGDASGKVNKLELGGRALPYRQGFTFGSELREKTTFYQGNPTASQQVLGTQKAPSTFKGMWKTKYLDFPIADITPSMLEQTAQNITDSTSDFLHGTSFSKQSDKSIKPAAIALWNNEQITDAMTLRQKAEKLLNDGIPVRVEWDEITRYGLLVKFTPDFERREDIAWTMDFKWAGSEKDTKYVYYSTSRAQNILNQIQAFLKWLNDTAGAVKDVVSAVTDFVIDAMQTLQNLAQSLVDLINGAISIGQTVLDVAKSAMNTVQGIIAQAQSVVTTIDELCAEAISIRDDAESISNSQLFCTTTWSECHSIQASATEMWEQLDRMLEPDVIGSFPIPAGMDLRKVSIKYYGTSDYWQTLADYNGLTTSLPPAGTIILIPRIANSAIGGTA